MRKALVLLVLAGLSACGKPADPTATASTEAPASDGVSAATASGPSAGNAPPADVASKPLPDRLDCLRQTGGSVLIGHRGGPTRDYPENAIETFERTLKAGTRAMEIDIAQTRDGVLVLMHDDELDRTTTGKGLVADTTWTEIKALKLRTYSKTTDFAPPTLEAALRWAVSNNVLVELDKKRGAGFPPIIAQVRAAKAENHVFVITYTDAQAAEVHKLAPDLVITATVRDAAHLDSLIASGVKPERLVAWTGTETPDPALWQALATRGIESAFGTLGRRDTSLDNRYWADGDGAEFNKLVEADGLSLLVTDLTDKVSRQISADLARGRACGF